MVQLLGNLFILSAPSGAGKSSLIKALLEKQTSSKSKSTTDMTVSISHTTRMPRPGEINGEHYHFVSRSEFEDLIKEGAFFEFAEVFGNYYGTSRITIEETLSKGIDVFLDIDWQGARQVKQQLPEAIGIFILPPSIPVLRSRLDNRGQDTESIIASRMQKAKDEMRHYDEFDFVLVNDDFATTLTAFESIVFAHRQRLHDQKLRNHCLIEALIG